MNQETVHLDAQRLEAYRTRTLDPAALLAAADHLAECAECRARAAEPPAIGHLRDSLETTHLTEAELEAFAEDALSDPDACEHLAACSRCADDAHDLRRFVRTHSEAPRTRWLRPVWPVAAATALCAAALAGWFVTRPKPPANIAAVAPAAVAGLPADLRQLLDSAVAAGRVDAPASIAALRGVRETQLGGNAAAAPIQLETPLATATLSPVPISAGSLCRAHSLIKSPSSIVTSVPSSPAPFSATRIGPRPTIWRLEPSTSGN